LLGLGIDAAAAAVTVGRAIAEIGVAAKERADAKRHGLALLPGELVRLRQVQRHVDDVQRPPVLLFIRAVIVLPP